MGSIQLEWKGSTRMERKGRKKKVGGPSHSPGIWLPPMGEAYMKWFGDPGKRPGGES